MKLYTDWHGNWVGTQAEAKKLERNHQVDVPTDKPNLLTFLNENDVGAVKDWAKQVQYIDKKIEENTQEQQRSNSRWTAKDLNGFDIRDIAQEASLKDLTFAMAVYLNRIDEELS